MDLKKIFVRPEELETYSPEAHSGTVNRRLIGKETVGAENFEVVLGELASGGGAQPHSHPDSEHGYYVLEGKCVIEVGHEKQEVSQGMAVFIPKGVEHALTVVEPLKVLVFFSPPLQHSIPSR